MFGKIHERLDHISNHVRDVWMEISALRSGSRREHLDLQLRLDSIETWMELAVDTKADEIAERFDQLLREHKGKVTNQVLKDLVRQAAKGQ